MPQMGTWLYVLVAVLVVLAILYLVGVRFDLNASTIVLDDFAKELS